MHLTNSFILVALIARAPASELRSWQDKLGGRSLKVARTQCHLRDLDSATLLKPVRCRRSYRAFARRLAKGTPAKGRRPEEGDLRKSASQSRGLATASRSVTDSQSGEKKGKSAAANARSRRAKSAITSATEKSNLKVTQRGTKTIDRQRTALKGDATGSRTRKRTAQKTGNETKTRQMSNGADNTVAKETRKNTKAAKAKPRQASNRTGDKAFKATGEKIGLDAKWRQTSALADNRATKRKHITQPSKEEKRRQMCDRDGNDTRKKASNKTRGDETKQKQMSNHDVDGKREKAGKKISLDAKPVRAGNKAEKPMPASKGTADRTVKKSGKGTKSQQISKRKGDGKVKNKGAKGLKVSDRDTEGPTKKTANKASVSQCDVDKAVKKPSKKTGSKSQKISTLQGRKVAKKTGDRTGADAKRQMSDRDGHKAPKKTSYKSEEAAKNRRMSDDNGTRTSKKRGNRTGVKKRCISDHNGNKIVKKAAGNTGDRDAKKTLMGTGDKIEANRRRRRTPSEREREAKSRGDRDSNNTAKKRTSKTRATAKKRLQMHDRACHKTGKKTANKTSAVAKRRLPSGNKTVGTRRRRSITLSSLPLPWTPSAAGLERLLLGLANTSNDTNSTTNTKRNSTNRTLEVFEGLHPDILTLRRCPEFFQLHHFIHTFQEHMKLPDVEAAEFEMWIARPLHHPRFNKYVRRLLDEDCEEKQSIDAAATACLARLRGMDNETNLSAAGGDDPLGTNGVLSTRDVALRCRCLVQLADNKLRLSKEWGQVAGKRTDKKQKRRGRAEILGEDAQGCRYRFGNDGLPRLYRESVPAEDAELVLSTWFVSKLAVSEFTHKRRWLSPSPEQWSMVCGSVAELDALVATLVSRARKLPNSKRKDRESALLKALQRAIPALRKKEVERLESEEQQFERNRKEAVTTMLKEEHEKKLAEKLAAKRLSFRSAPRPVTRLQTRQAATNETSELQSLSHDRRRLFDRRRREVSSEKLDSYFSQVKKGRPMDRGAVARGRPRKWLDFKSTAARNASRRAHLKMRRKNTTGAEIKALGEPTGQARRKRLAAWKEMRDLGLSAALDLGSPHGKRRAHLEDDANLQNLEWSAGVDFAAARAARRARLEARRDSAALGPNMHDGLAADVPNGLARTHG
eukprot:gnl/TRDRNA2_/TRDRNA2_171416_c0_seq3.p1 gnl/TRDRNA2_/TRDRNA2_171416_c0~~gnl/TRDRNA2_/TRDRNA2_171416_c0_seq3.p1  ORF type:complete len:1143 (-),score=205.80 gnl/TRDRNA2_/TRDRNA2_171416_c0_seq3:16-3444(-)